MVIRKNRHPAQQKIEKSGIPLKDWDINIYRGILTGFNEAFIIDKEKKDIFENITKDENAKGYGYLQIMENNLEKLKFAMNCK